jgi:hypothetical protein
LEKEDKVIYSKPNQKVVELSDISIENRDENDMRLGYKPSP